jgi:hypothetical protein
LEGDDLLACREKIMWSATGLVGCNNLLPMRSLEAGDLLACRE